MDVRPYLIFPKLIEQPTWGGTYIVEYKGWQSHAELLAKKFGQSYELSGSSKLSSSIKDSSTPEFVPENASLNEAVSLDSLSIEDAQQMFGVFVYEQYKKMPLLIKFTQAKGNSFQLHKKPEVEDPEWLPKAESWYFFENGYITFGLKAGMPVEAYKKTCEEIDVAMQELSKKILAKEITVEEASQQAKEMIKEKNPWQYVNVLHVPKHTMLDLSGGGLHHSWEEDPDSQLGNIVYEVQQDAPDETSTLRSFDQGKIKADGTIRSLTIEQYFRFMDTNPTHNDVNHAKQMPFGNRILTTTNYYMDLYTLEDEMELSTGDSFAHLFVREGDVIVEANGVPVRLTKGHSCLIPQAANTFKLTPKFKNSVVIRTGIEKQ